MWHLAIGALLLAVGSAQAHAGHTGPLSGSTCGRPGSQCEILAQNISSPRSLSRVLADGSFFVGSAGSPFDDLFGEAETGTDVDSSTIFRYTTQGGLQPWVTRRPSQLITVFDPTFGGLVPFQAGINGVEVVGADLVYSLAYNRGTTDYVERMRSFTVETGITFAEVRRIAGGVADPQGPETVIANLGRAEIEKNNPDGVVFPVDNLTHRAGDPEYESNPFGLLPQGNKVLVVDAAGNDLYRIHENGRLELMTVFTRFLEICALAETLILDEDGLYDDGPWSAIEVGEGRSRFSGEIFLPSSRSWGSLILSPNPPSTTVSLSTSCCPRRAARTTTASSRMRRVVGVGPGAAEAAGSRRARSAENVLPLRKLR